MVLPDANHPVKPGCWLGEAARKNRRQFLNCRQTGGCALFRKFLQRFAGDPVHGPVGHGLCPQGKIKIYTGFVPVQAPPFQPAAFALRSNFGQLFQDGFSVPRAPGTGAKRTNLPGRARLCSGRWKNCGRRGQSQSPFPPGGEDHLRLFFIKNPLFQGCLVGYHLVQHFFVIRQFPDEPQDQGGIFSLCVSEMQFRLHLTLSRIQNLWLRFSGDSAPLFFIVFPPVPGEYSRLRPAQG